MWIQELLTELTVRESGNSKNLADNSEVIDQFYHFYKCFSSNNPFNFDT